MTEREIQRLMAAISRRDWQETEAAANAIRDTADRRKNEWARFNAWLEDQP